MNTRDNGPGRGKPFTPDRRCHWFDSNGRPFKRLDGGLGCPRGGKCYFAHPTDLEHWQKAKPGGEPPLHYLTDDEYRLIMGRHRSPMRSFHPGQRPRSPSPGRRRSPPRRFISREREIPSLASRIRGRSASREREARRLAPRNSRSRSPGRGRLQRATPPPPRGPRVSMGGPPPEGPRGGSMRSPVVFPKAEPDVAMRDATRPATYRREDSVASSHHPAQQNTPSRTPANHAGHTTAPAQTPSGNASSVAASAATTQSSQPDAIKTLLESSALQWEQISSAVAAASSVPSTRPKMTPPSGEGLSEDRAKIWSNRIELLAAATRVHNECRSMENDVRDYKQLVESFSYQSLPAEDRTVIEGHMHTLQAQLAEKSEEMKKALTQLAEAQYWTTYGDSSSTAPQVAGQEITKHVQGLKVSVSQLQSLFTTVGTHWESVAKSLQSNRLSNIGNHAMDTSGAPQGVGQSNALIAEVIVPKELEKIRNTIASFDVRLKAVENAAAESSEVVGEQIDALVAENVQALMLAATGSVQASPPPPRPANALTAQQRKMLETLQQNASVTQQHVQRLSQKVTEMATENEQLQGENAQLHAENVQLRQQLSESMSIQQPAGSDSAKLDQMQSEMRALNAAVVAYLAQRPASTPTLPSADILVEQVAASLPRVIVPELQGLRDQIQETLRTQQTQFLKELSFNVSSTRQSVEDIRALLEKIPNQESTPTASDSPINGNEMNGEVTQAEQ
ncbi:uncharacterized protein TRAVEDRAFT_30369 [Trametes versicolor FP-101664 SS1]|uniref:uncharacterized protein n=1 Tax=Trametes versicolor (strain FP-101664) TaxID=717944 RepID=UPI0004623F26|nr:uncharacterized protein TRAVEDRAFT_30369 [Trametes versicolor FP-101664 SS1]EIW55566.1 hypothetical protein TRAVEDRAFT_30369 [Trametes versicolor FP-101664 SS1]